MNRAIRAATNRGKVTVQLDPAKNKPPKPKDESGGEA
jgi:hypothetical protein